MHMKMKNLAVAMTFIALSANADIYMAGDSTMCNYPARQYPKWGWGQALGEFMKNPDQLHNWAIGGRSARSFKEEGRWQKLMDALKPEDSVIVAFGHNDSNRGKTERYSTPEEFKERMKAFATEVRAKGAEIVFATSVPHSGGLSKDAEGKTHMRASAAGLGPYVAATLKAGEELKVPVIDLNDFGRVHFEEIGMDKAMKYYMRIEPNEYLAFPNGCGDGCHLRDTGAFCFAKKMVEEAFARNLPIAKYFKPVDEVKHALVGYAGPGTKVKPIKDDFSKEEIGYANEDGTPYDPYFGDWRAEMRDLERHARSIGEKNPRAWAAAEFRRRHPKK